MKKHIKRINNLKSIFILTTIAALLICFSACERITQITQPPTQQADDKSTEITIGVVLPLTGHLTASGERMRQGFELAFDEINSTQLNNTILKPILEDSMSSPPAAVDAFNKLIHEDGVFVILGPATSSATKLAFPVAQENQTVAISPTSGSRGLSALGDFLFRIPLASNVLALNGVKTTHAKLAYERVATMYDETDVFSTDRNDALREALSDINIEVITTEIFKGGDTDFTAQLNRINELEPDAIFISALPPEKAPILIQAQTLGISVPMIMSSLTNTDVTAAGPAAEGVITFIGWLPTDDTPGNQAFVDKYHTTFGMIPDVFAAASYTSVHILTEAIKNAEVIDSISIRDALANTSNLDTIFGKFSFNADGDAVYEQKALIVKDGMLQPFE